MFDNEVFALSMPCYKIKRDAYLILIKKVLCIFHHYLI